MNTNVQFAKIYTDARIPTKRNDGVSFDVYLHFNNDYFVLEPHETFPFATGIISSCDPAFCFVLKESFFVGQHGVSLSSCAIDSGNRNDWHLVLTNTSNDRFVISKLSEKDTYEAIYPGKVTEHTLSDGSGLCRVIEGAPTTFVYPYSNAIAQALVIPVQNVESEELSCEDILAIPGSHF